MNLKNSICVALFFTCFVAFGQPDIAGKTNFIVEPYLQQVNDGSFHVLWETSLSGRGFVKLGVAEYNVLRPNLDRSFQEEASGIYHRVSVTGLKVDESYFYQALTIDEKGDTLPGPVTPLHIPDFNRMPVSFAVVGDTRDLLRFGASLPL